MPWNFMQIDLVPEDMQARPMIGAGGLSREQALAEVQSLLDQGAKGNPDLAQTAALWRRGATDDTVYAGPFTWTVYEHQEGEDPRKAALEWLEDYARIMHAAGLTSIQVAKLPD